MGTRNTVTGVSHGDKPGCKPHGHLVKLPHVNQPQATSGWSLGLCQENRRREHRSSGTPSPAEMAGRRGNGVKGPGDRTEPGPGAASPAALVDTESQPPKLKAAHPTQTQADAVRSALLRDRPPAAGLARPSGAALSWPGLEVREADGHSRRAGAELASDSGFV